jgi:hypothetical protein
MFERQLGVEGWKFRTAFVAVSEGIEKHRGKKSNEKSREEQKVTK